MRLATGVSFRMTRVAPTEALVYKEHVIPPGVRIIFRNVVDAVSQLKASTPSEFFQLIHRLHPHGFEHFPQSPRFRSGTLDPSC